MLKKIVIYQQELLGQIPSRDYEVIESMKPDFLCLPEYFFHPEKISFENAIKHMSKISNDLQCVFIAGSTILKENDKEFNSCFIFENGNMIGHYKKIHLFEREIGRITPGTDYRVFEAGSVNVGLLICADALYPEAWQKMSDLNPDIIFIPTFSPYKNETIEEKFKRDEEIYVKGASLCGCPVIKVCCTGQVKDTKLQGRSLAALPGSVLWRVAPEYEDRHIIKLLELDLV